MPLISLLPLEMSTGANSIVKRVIRSEERVTFVLSGHPGPSCQVFTFCPHCGTVSGECLPFRLWLLATGMRQFLFSSERKMGLINFPSHSISQGHLCEVQYWKGTKAYDAPKICVSASLTWEVTHAWHFVVLLPENRRHLSVRYLYWESLLRCQHCRLLGSPKPGKQWAGDVDEMFSWTNFLWLLFCLNFWNKRWKTISSEDWTFTAGILLNRMIIT